MKSYLGLIPRYLRYQSRRALLICIGIMLSVALMTFLLLFVTNLKEFRLQTSERLYGTYEARFSDLDGQQVRSLSQHPLIQELEQAWTVKIPMAENSDSVVEVAAVEHMQMQTMLPVQLLQGRVPLESSEIALTEWALAGLHKEQTLGQTISYAGRTLTLVGIIGNRGLSWSGSRTVGLVTSEAMNDLAARGFEKETSAYVRYRSSEFKQESEYYAQTAAIRGQIRMESSNINHNDELLEAVRQYHQQDMPSLLVILINCLATVMAIYNMFYISVLEKMKQYGILRALGMNAKQLRKVIWGEAVLLSIFSIPIGLLLGWGALKLLGSFLNANNTMTISTTWQVLAVVSLIGTLTIFAAAFRPAIQAGRTSPLEALRFSAHGMRQTASVKPVTNRLFGKLFGITGHLAYANITRSKSRFTVTVITLSIAIVLFIGVHYFTIVQDPAASIRHLFPWQSDYSLQAGSSREGRGFDERSLAEVRQIEGVREAVAVKYSYGYAYFKPDELAPGFKTLLEVEQEGWENPYSRSNELTSLIKYYFYSSEILSQAKAYLIDGHVDIDALQRGEEMLLIQVDAEPQITRKAGDLVEIGHTQLIDGPKNDNWQFDSQTRQIRIGGILHGFPLVGSLPEGIHIVGHQDGYRSFSGSDLYRKISVRLEDDANRILVEKALKSIAKSANGKFSSYEEQKREIDREFQVITRMLYAFTVIVTLIGALSILNTMVTHLFLRTREFGIMRAIGMSAKQLRQMIRMEGIIYSLYSSFWGALFGTASTFAVYRYVSAELPSMVTQWQFPMKSVVIAFLGTLLVVGLASFWPMRRLSRISIVDSVRYTE